MRLKQKLLLISAALSVSALSYAQTIEYPLLTLNWPPYVGEELGDQGYVAKLVKRAFEEGGAEVSYQFMPWARALLSAEQGKSVGLFPEYYDEGRLSDFTYSDPFPGGRVGLLKLSKKGYAFASDPAQDEIKALQSLSQAKFGVVRGYINTEAFDKAGFLVKRETHSDHSNLNLLQRERVDLIFIDEVVADYIIRTYMPGFQGQTEMLEPTLARKQLYIAFSLKHPDHAQAKQVFNRGLAALKKSGEMRRILQEFDIPY